MSTQLTKHFNLSEFSCPCCGISPDFDTVIEIAVLLECMRVELDKPIHINSALRCVAHNFNVGGVSDSQHLLGKAVDIYVDDISPTYLAVLAYRYGFRSIGIGNDFVHLDMRHFGDKNNLDTIWHY